MLDDSASPARRDRESGHEPSRRRRTRRGKKPQYVPVEARILEQFLQEHGFRRTVQGNEIVYVRDHHCCKDEHHRHCQGVRVKVYTSIRIGDATVRESGADAIRVACVYEGDKPLLPPASTFAGRNSKGLSTSFGIARLPRINRTGSTEKILARLLDRMRTAYRAGTHYLQQHWQEINKP